MRRRKKKIRRPRRREGRRLLPRVGMARQLHWTRERSMVSTVQARDLCVCIMYRYVICVSTVGFDCAVEGRVSVVWSECKPLNLLCVRVCVNTV